MVNRRQWLVASGGSDRPANAKPTDIEAFRAEDEGRNFTLVKNWAPDTGLRQKLPVDNATKLFGFTAV